MDVLEKAPQEERTRVKRWLILLFVAILLGIVGLASHQHSLEALAAVIAVLAIALLLWSAVRFSLGVRPPGRLRRSRRARIPHIGHGARPGAYTEELHAAIFQDQTPE